jgi:glycosyltransferase involved in cell wall biosynthesis
MADISVVIPSYNRASLIPETLDAVLSQTVPPDEVIVVDDGSDDNTQSVLASYGNRIRPIYIPNSGDLVARNTGLREARGRLVAFCDSDDLWTADFLAHMSSQWRATADLIVCYSDFRILQKGVLSDRSKFEDAPHDFWSGLSETGAGAGVFKHPIVKRLLSFQPFFPSCMVVSRAAFLNIGGWDEGVGVGSDFATTIRVARQASLGVVRRPLVAIRKHGSNFSRDTEKMNLRDARVLEHVLSTCPELACLGNEIRKSMTSRRRAALDSAFSRRDFAAVREIYRLLRPNDLLARQRIKGLIATLPQPINTLAAALVSR